MRPSGEREWQKNVKLLILGNDSIDFVFRRDGRVDDGGGLENRYAGDCIVGSNPTPSATTPPNSFDRGVA